MVDYHKSPHSATSLFKNEVIEYKLPCPVGATSLFKNEVIEYKLPCPVGATSLFKNEVIGFNQLTDNQDLSALTLL